MIYKLTFRRVRPVLPESLIPTALKYYRFHGDIQMLLPLSDSSSYPIIPRAVASEGESRPIVLLLHIEHIMKIQATSGMCLAV